MEKNNKTFLYIVSTILVIGLALITAGSLFGGWTQAAELTKNSQFTSFIFSAPSKNLAQTMGTAIPENATATGKVMNLDISLDSGNIEIETYKGSDTNISSSSKVKYYEKDGTLYISGKDGDISLQIPDDITFNNATINVGAVDLDADKLFCNDLVLKIGAGEVDISKLIVANFATIHVGAGDLDISSANIKSTDIDLGLGNIEISGVITEDMKLKCGMGNATLNLADSKDNHSISTTCGMGNINIDESSFVSFGKTQEYETSSDSNYDIKCGMGNVNVNFKE